MRSFHQTLSKAVYALLTICRGRHSHIVSGEVVALIKTRYVNAMSTVYVCLAPEIPLGLDVKLGLAACAGLSLLRQDGVDDAMRLLCMAVGTPATFPVAQPETDDQLHLSVQVPPGTAPGAVLQFPTPDGRTTQIVVPEWALPGQYISAAIPPLSPWQPCADELLSSDEALTWARVLGGVALFWRIRYPASGRGVELHRKVTERRVALLGDGHPLASSIGTPF